MTRRHRLLIAAGAAVVALAGAAWGYWVWYAAPMKDLEAQIAKVAGDLERREAEVARGKGDRARLRAMSLRSLGSDGTAVQSEARSTLNEIVASYGMTDPRVWSKPPEAVHNPAVLARVTELTSRPLRTPDFYTVSANFTATGTLDQALRVLATVRAQDWVHRCDSFSIKVVGKARDRVQLTAGLTTIYFAGAAATSGGADWKRLDDAAFAAWQPIALKNVFREAAPPGAAVALATPAGPPPAAPVVPPPYGDWRLSGVAVGKDGPELWMTDQKARRTVTLTPGKSLLDALLVEVVGETARFKIGETVYEVAMNQTLADRRAVAR